MPRTITKTRAAKKLPTEFADLVRAHPPTAIHDEAAYANAMEYIDALTEIPDPSRGQLEYLDTLSVLVGAYEDEAHAIDTNLSPLDILKHLVEEHGMSASDLGRLLGERSLGTKILGGDRELSKAHIRTLAKHFRVPADLFL